MSTFSSFYAMPITKLSGVGPALAKKLEKLGVTTVQDVLFHLPYRYQDRTQVTPMMALVAGEYAVVEGEVIDVRVIQRRTRMLQVILSDGTATVSIFFFHFNTSQKARFEQGGSFRFFGQVKGFGRELSLTHPEWINLATLSNQHMQESLTPIYSTTEGVGQKVWWQLTEHALALFKKNTKELPDLLPSLWLERFSLPSLAEALEILHRPPPGADMTLLLSGLHPAQQRLASEELLAHYLSLRQLREKATHFSAIPLQGTGEISTALFKQLPFALTSAQTRVLNEILSDLAKPSPMQRLVQGDVGSGKTIVAAFSAIAALENHCQIAYMAPTELLAEQHIKNFKTWFDPLGVEVFGVTGMLNKGTREKIQARLLEKKACIVVGTHALFQASVEFSNLALVIIDEQHRFGVDQRLALRDKGKRQAGSNTFLPHQLIMTATPIPRTLAMTAYADLDYSVIDELPPGRKPIETKVMSNTKRPALIESVAHFCGEGHQVYWVCPLIEESEVLQCQAAEVFFQELQQALPQCRIGLAHGRLKAKEKESVMAAFKAHELDILVATTVIEVGVDVPNATMMIIENAERLGLAQLHQLRGRVGRGDKQSFCLLLYQAPLGHTARLRLSAMRETQDGFEIAKKDLELRGPGEVLGTRQTGAMQFLVADLVRDQVWVDRIRALPSDWAQQHPQQAEQLMTRWGRQGLAYRGV